MATRWTPDNQRAVAQAWRDGTPMMYVFKPHNHTWGARNDTCDAMWAVLIDGCPIAGGRLECDDTGLSWSPVPQDCKDRMSIRHIDY